MSLEFELKLFHCVIHYHEFGTSFFPCSDSKIAQKKSLEIIREVRDSYDIPKHVSDYDAYMRWPKYTSNQEEIAIDAFEIINSVD